MTVPPAAPPGWPLHCPAGASSRSNATAMPDAQSTSPLEAPAQRDQPPQKPPPGAPTPSERVPAWVRGFVALFLIAFLLCGVFAIEAWPLTGWKLFSPTQREPLRLARLHLRCPRAPDEGRLRTLPPRGPPPPADHADLRQAVHAAQGCGVPGLGRAYARLRGSGLRRADLPHARPPA